MENGSSQPTAAALVHEYYQAVYRFAYRLSRSQTDAEDLTQHTFLTACRKLDGLRDPEKARSWLFTIVRNAYLKSRPQQDAPVVSLDDSPEPAGEWDPEVSFDGERITTALNDLPDAFRLPLLLYYFEDLPYKEISAILNVPIGTVMSRLARGKEYLRCSLGTPETTP